MRILKQLLFAAVVMICFSMTVSAQKEGDKNNPPKDKNPPVIVIKPKDPPKDDKPKDDKKKPQAVIFYIRDERRFG